jgi:hypothetical protein
MSRKELKNLFKLSHKVSVYVPTLQQSGEAVKDGWVETTAALLSKLFGGSTSSDCVGYWILASGKLQREAVKLVFSYAEKITDDAVDAVYQHSLSMKSACNQEAVAIEIDGELYFV